MQRKDEALRDFDRAVAAAATATPLVRAAIQFDRARALWAMGRHPEGLSAARAARMAVPAGATSRPLLDQIDTWLDGK